MSHQAWKLLSRQVFSHPQALVTGVSVLACVAFGACIGAYLFVGVGIVINAASLVAASDVATKVALMMSIVGYGVVGLATGAILGTGAVPFVLHHLARRTAGTAQASSAAAIAEGSNRG